MSVTIYTDIEKFDKEDEIWKSAHPEQSFYISEWDKKTFESEPFQTMGSSISAFIAGVRNHYHIPRNFEMRGVPIDNIDSHENNDKHMSSAFSLFYFDNTPYPHIPDEAAKTWTSLKELLDFNYDDIFEDRSDPNGHMRSTVEEGEGVKTTYREFLGESYFHDLKVLESMGDPSEIRLVWGFF